MLCSLGIHFPWSGEDQLSYCLFCSRNENCVADARDWETKNSFSQKNSWARFAAILSYVLIFLTTSFFPGVKLKIVLMKRTFAEFFITES